MDPLMSQLPQLKLNDLPEDVLNLIWGRVFDGVIEEMKESQDYVNYWNTLDDDRLEEMTWWEWALS
jgi:hypothetical protein